jgi:hypothetical protein
VADTLPPKLKKLPGFAFNVLGVNRAWLAGDHLLVSSSAAAFETYRRYYFREIKALVVRPTATGIVWNILLGLLLAGLGSAAVAMWMYARARGNFPIGTTIFGGIGLVVAAILILQIIRGQTCRVYVQTRAGIEQLAAPVRVPAAYKLHEALRTHVGLAQEGEAFAPARPPPPPPGVLPPTDAEGGLA